jgi:hypothetical protein
MERLAMAGDPHTPDLEVGGCLGRSCMKWGEDGELSPLDLQAVLQRLGAVDEQASRLMDCSLDLA